MKIYIFFPLLLLLCASCNQEKCSIEKQEVSECLGDILWNELCKESVDYDLEIVLSTMRKNSKGKRDVLKNPRFQLSKYIEKTNEKKAITALKRAEVHLANLTRQNGFKSLKQGKLLYKVLTPGTGSIIEKGSSPLLHFVEKDLDGEILYDSYKTDSPLRLPLEETILGFQLGTAGMRVGEQREIIVHPDLAYKKLGKTKPNQLLIYNVTVLEE